MNTARAVFADAEEAVVEAVGEQEIRWAEMKLRGRLKAEDARRKLEALKDKIKQVDDEKERLKTKLDAYNPEVVDLTGTAEGHKNDGEAKEEIAIPRKDEKRRRPRKKTRPQRESSRSPKRKRLFY